MRFSRRQFIASAGCFVGGPFAHVGVAEGAAELTHSSRRSRHEGTTPLTVRSSESSPTSARLSRNTLPRRAAISLPTSSRVEEIARGRCRCQAHSAPFGASTYPLAAQAPRDRRQFHRQVRRLVHWSGRFRPALTARASIPGPYRIRCRSGQAWAALRSPSPVAGPSDCHDGRDHRRRTTALPAADRSAFVRQEARGFPVPAGVNEVEGVVAPLLQV